MSSSNNTTVSTHVPILDGTNYREWAAQIQAYLWSTGLWLIVNGTTMAPTDPQALTAWTLSDSIVNGNIELHLLHNIHDQVGDTSAWTWTNLAKAFGVTGVSHLFWRVPVTGPVLYQRNATSQCRDESFQHLC